MNGFRNNYRTIHRIGLVLLLFSMGCAVVPRPPPSDDSPVSGTRPVGQDHSEDIHGTQDAETGAGAE